MVFDLNDKMTAKFVLFMQLSEIAYQSEQFLWNKFCDLMLSLESDKMTTLGTNGSLSFTLVNCSTIPKSLNTGYKWYLDIWILGYFDIWKKIYQ